VNVRKNALKLFQHIIGVYRLQFEAILHDGKFPPIDFIAQEKEQLALDVQVLEASVARGEVQVLKIMDSIGEDAKADQEKLQRALARNKEHQQVIECLKLNRETLEEQKQILQGYEVYTLFFTQVSEAIGFLTQLLSSKT